MKKLLTRPPSLCLLISSLIFLLGCIAAIIYGFVERPEVFEDTTEVSSYGCSQNVLRFNASLCAGVDLAVTSSAFSTSVSNLPSQASILRLIAIPQNSFDREIERIQFTASYSIEYRNKEEDSWTFEDVGSTDVIITCKQGNATCNSLQILEIKSLKYSMYRTNVSFIGYPIVGDTRFMFEYGGRTGYDLLPFAIAGGLFGAVIILMILEMCYLCCLVKKLGQFSDTMSLEETNIFWK